MAKKFGKRVQFDVADLREMLRAMCSQVPGFKKYMSEAHMKGIRFAFFNGDNNIGLEEFDMTRGGSVYRIVPVYEGPKFGRPADSCRCRCAGRRILYRRCEHGSLGAAMSATAISATSF
jgi:predicted phage tail protein